MRLAVDCGSIQHYILVACTTTAVQRPSRMFDLPSLSARHALMPYRLSCSFLPIKIYRVIVQQDVRYVPRKPRENVYDTDVARVGTSHRWINLVSLTSIV